MSSIGFKLFCFCWKITELANKENKIKNTFLVFFLTLYMLNTKTDKIQKFNILQHNNNFQAKSHDQALTI